MRKVLAAMLAMAAMGAGQTRDKRVVPVDSNVRQTFEKQPKIAILAGVGQYPSRSGLGRLHFPAHDVDLLEMELMKQGYKTVALKDQEATRGSIEQALRDAADMVDRGQGTVLFFFSGHGFADKGENYLASFEATAGDLAGTGMPVKRVEALLKATGAPRQVMFLDACRNEPGKSAGARSFARFQASAGMHELLSTKEGRISYEDDGLGSGVFTHFLVLGLRGDAAGPDGLITFRDLADFVTEGVSTYGFERGQMQVPYEAGESSGDFLLGHIGAATRAGEVKTNPKDGLKYVWIPAGEFWMGCSPGDGLCADDQKPRHAVTIRRGFWLGQTHVTQTAYERVTGINPSLKKDPAFPVSMVSWTAAGEYCRATGGRLPTEAEWEYAARAGQTGASNGDLKLSAWYSENSGSAPHPAGQKQANAFGLYDILGNLYQWVADWYGAYPAGAQTDPTGAVIGQARVLRGGSWITTELGARLSSRYRNPPDAVSELNGFRCAMDN